MDAITDIVAIDGPAGAGKSTVARQVAARLGYAFLDTGAMYRAATWRALEQGIDMADPAALAKSTQIMQLDITHEDGAQRVRVDGRNVTDAIRSPEVTREIHWLDCNPDVRACLVAQQRALGARQPTVAEGRDMGTVVFPRARCKVYLDASLDERTRRRAGELEARGVAVDRGALREAIHARDQSDMTRTIAPLCRAPDAVVVDTTSLTLDAVVERITALARERL